MTASAARINDTERKPATVTFNDPDLLVPPDICGLAEVAVAQAQMQRHRQCRIHRCAWKHAAYRTLVEYGALAPAELGPRERAHRRGIEFPSTTDDSALHPDAAPDYRTFQQVLDGLTRLADNLRTEPGIEAG